LEWRLVTITGNVESVHRDGDSWRAEIAVGGGTIPIVGIDRSGIPATALVEGRTATVVGIVKRAYPTASDQRLAVVPRTTRDVTLSGPLSSPVPSAGPTPRPQPGASPGAPNSSGGGNDPAGGGNGSPGGGSPAASDRSSLTPDSTNVAGSGSLVVRLADLAEHVGESVTVSGRISGTAAGIVSVTDGVATAAVRLDAGAAALVEELRVGDIVNVHGTVARTAAGAIELLVSDRAAITRLPAYGPRSPGGPTPESTAQDGATVATPVDPTVPTSDSRLSAIAAAVLLLAIAALVVVVTAAGPARRAKAREWLSSAVAQLRSRIALRARG
jgi:hypothetical protein